jgi:hypothetical protein
MGMPQPSASWTAAKVRALPPDGKRYEVVGGRLLVTPAPGLLHQRAVLAVARFLTDFVVRHGIGEVLISPADIEFDMERSFSRIRSPLVEGKALPSWQDVTTLLLAVGCYRRPPLDMTGSPNGSCTSNRPLSIGLSIDARVVERWLPGGEPDILADHLEWRRIPAALH